MGSPIFLPLTYGVADYVRAGRKQALLLCHGLALSIFAYGIVLTCSILNPARLQNEKASGLLSLIASFENEVTNFFFFFFFLEKKKRRIQGMMVVRHISANDNSLEFIELDRKQKKNP